jgi:DNA-binding CsgD family transcriptional regulator
VAVPGPLRQRLFADREGETDDFVSEVTCQFMGQKDILRYTLSTGPDIMEGLALRRHRHGHSAMDRPDPFPRESAPQQGPRTKVESVIDLVVYGLILLDHQAKPLQINRAARRLLNEGDGVYLRRGRVHLEASSGAKFAHIFTCLSQANYSVSFEVKRPSNGTLTGTLLRSPGNTVDWLPGSTAILIMVDPVGQANTVITRMRSEFGLTTAECRFAAAFASVADLQQASRVLGIAVETGRRHLKSIFHKTGTHSQIALRHLLTAHPSALFAYSL